MLQDAPLDIVRRLHGKPAQAFLPGGHPGVKPPGQHHLCCHKWRVEYPLGTIYLTLSRHCLHEGRHPPYVFVQGSLRPVVGVAQVLFEYITRRVDTYTARTGLPFPQPIPTRDQLDATW